MLSRIAQPLFLAGLCFFTRLLDLALHLESDIVKGDAGSRVFQESNRFFKFSGKAWSALLLKYILSATCGNRAL